MDIGGGAPPPTRGASIFGIIEDGSGIGEVAHVHTVDEFLQKIS